MHSLRFYLTSDMRIATTGGRQQPWLCTLASVLETNEDYSLQESKNSAHLPGHGTMDSSYPYKKLTLLKLKPKMRVEWVR